MVATENRGRRGFQPRSGNKHAAGCRFYRLQSAPLPASVPCESTERALERGHYLTEVQRHEEHVKAATACWLPWNDQEQLAESFLQRGSSLA